MVLNFLVYILQKKIKRGKKEKNILQKEST